MADDFEKELDRGFAAIDEMQRKLSGPVGKDVLTKSANRLADAVKRLVPVADRPVHRYDAMGKKVATYYPGNLRRSMQVLDHIDSRAVFVGYKVPPRGRARGSFQGDRVDGWYAKFVEFKDAPLRKGWDRMKGKMISEIVAEMRAAIDKMNR